MRRRCAFYVYDRLDIRMSWCSHCSAVSHWMLLRVVAVRIFAGHLSSLHTIASHGISVAICPRAVAALLAGWASVIAGWSASVALF